MRLTDLEVRCFRNVRAAHLQPDAGVNVLWGRNAQGKTNLLEAAFYLVTGRSFRTRADKECLPWTERVETWAVNGPPLFGDGVMTAVIRGRVQRAAGAHEILITIDAAQKRVTIDGKSIARLGELWGKLNAVLFTPADLAIVQGGPAQRRQFLDTTLSQISPTYLRRLQQYTHALRQRNALLRSWRPGRPLSEHFDIWEAQLVENALPLAAARIEHLDTLMAEASTHYAAIAGAEPASAGEGAPDTAPTGAEVLSARYQGFFKTLEAVQAPDSGQRFAERLKRSREEDARRGGSSVGPHRDDFAFLINGRELRDFGSQGQQRSTILALRLAEVDVMTRETRETPVLLLDDIIAELDPRRTAAFLQRLAGMDVQSLITTTDAQAVADHIPPRRLWRIRDGQPQDHPANHL